MSGTGLTTAQASKRAKKIVSSLAGLGDGDGLWILYIAVNTIVTHSVGVTSPGTIQTVNANFRPRRPGFRPMVERDLELRDYIHSLGTWMTIKELRADLMSKF